MTSEGIRPPPQTDEWGRLNHLFSSKGDQKVTERWFSGRKSDQKAVYWPLSGQFLAGSWPAFARTKGKNKALLSRAGSKGCPGT